MNSTGFSTVAAEADRRRALVAGLEAELAESPSVSRVLSRWCRARGLGDRIAAVRDPGVDLPDDAAVRSRLHATPGEPVRYRRVALTCGARVLCLADNWYRPARLTPAMNLALDATDTPFGLVIAPLGYRRLRFESRSAWEYGDPPGHVLCQRAVLLVDDAPVSYVIERYTEAVFDDGP